MAENIRDAEGVLRDSETGALIITIEPNADSTVGPVSSQGRSDTPGNAGPQDEIIITPEDLGDGKSVIRSEQEIPLTIADQEEPGFTAGLIGEDEATFPEFVKGVRDESLTVKAGEVLAEQQLKVQRPDLFGPNQQAKVFERWMPQIWDAEQEVNLNTFRKNTPEYQELTEKVQELKENFRLDMAGKYIEPPADPISISELFSMAVDNPAFTAGQLTRGLIADPGLMLIPGGMAKLGAKFKTAAQALKLKKAGVSAAQLSGQIIGGGSVAGSMGGAVSFVEQLEANPNAEINADSVMRTAAAFSLLGALPPPIFAGVKKAAGVTKTAVTRGVSSFYTPAKIDQIRTEAINIYNVGEGTLTKQQAIEQAVAKHHPFDEEKIFSKLDEPDVFIDDTAAQIAFHQNQTTESFAGMSKRVLLDSADHTVKAWNNMIQPVITGVRRLGLMGVATKLLRHDMNEMKKLSDRLLIKDSFSKPFKKMPETQRDLFKWHALNGTLDDVAGQFPDEVVKGYRDVRKMLDVMEKELIDNGMLVETGGVENFFPREIDFKKFAESKGLKINESFQLYADAINKKWNLKGVDAFEGTDLTSELVNEYLTPREIAFAVVDKVSGRGPAPKTSIATDPLKARTVDIIPAEDLQFYADPRVSLTNYILKMTPKIEARAFFGGKAVKQTNVRDTPSNDPKKNQLIDGFIDDFTSDLVDRGVMLEQKVPELAGLLEARFAGGFRRPNKFIQGAKNLMYASLLGNPFAASIQLGDLGSSAFVNGGIRTIESSLKVLARQNKLKMNDFGLRALSHEYEHMGWTAVVNDFSLKYGSFQAVDTLGKESIMNASLSKNMNAVKNLRKLRANPTSPDALAKAEAKALAHFRKQYGNKVDDQTIKNMVDAFVEGDIRNSDLRLAVFSDLTKVQPVTLSEMPALYLNHPNGRILYMLKTFTIKQIDLARTEIAKEFVREGKGGPAAKTRAMGRAMAKTAHLLGTIGIANASVDTMRKFMTGQEFEFTDAMFAAAMRTWGYNDYAFDLLRRGDVGGAAASLTMPPVNVLWAPVDWALFDGDGRKALRAVPIIGGAVKFADIDDEKPLFPSQSFSDLNTSLETE